MEEKINKIDSKKENKLDLFDVLDALDYFSEGDLEFLAKDCLRRLSKSVVGDIFKYYIEK
jgi:hypothetical protein